MDQAYEAEYERLNEDQREAVDNMAGPMLVIAGPGTGKTQLLSVRVANILRSTDTDPANILCLTFTNFAATNMRERLNKLVGPVAHNVYVRTFHSFAAELMQLYPDYFWNGARLSVVPDAVQLEIIQNILANLPLDNPLAIKFADNFTAISDVQAGLRLAKEAGLTPAKLRAMLDINDAYIDVIENELTDLLTDKLSVKRLDELHAAVDNLPDQAIDEQITPLRSLSAIIKDSLDQAIKSDKAAGKTTETGKWKRRWIQNVNGQKGMFDEKRRNHWWRALSGVYENYREVLHGRGYYDYSDMVVEVITGLEQNPELLSSVQERFSYVLIDEFQDTNKAQLRLAHLVASHYTNEGKPNLMAVGDDDQSIFAFNGAELNNMLAFETTYPGTRIIVLSKNYRSTQELLDISGSIISQADDRLVHRLPGLTKKLSAATKPPKGRIEHMRYATREHQLNEIAKHIKSSWESGGNRSLAVLARSHESLRKISGYLQNEGVPIRYEQQNNILDLELIKQLLLLAQIVSAISAGDEANVNYYMSRLLLHPLWRISPEQLWRLAAANYGSSSHWLNSLLQNKSQPLSDIAKWLMWLSAEASKEPLPVIIEYLVGLRSSKQFTSPLRNYFLSMRKIDNSYLESLSGLSVLQNLIYEFTSSVPSAPTLDDFIRFMKLNQELGRQVVDESWFISSEKAVQLLTIHKAKGLEFDSVYILDAIENDWRPKRIGRKPPANLPLQPYGEHFDDYVRLAYVGATRSRSSLIISSYSNDSKGQKLLATPLFSNLTLHESDASNDTPQEKIAVLENDLRWPRLTTDNEKSMLAPRMNDYRLSATGLLQFLDVSSGGPQQFLERQILKLPHIYTASMAYGVAMHYALQTAQQLVNKGGFDLEEVIKAYQKTLEREQQPATSYKRYLPHGIKVLENLFKVKGFMPAKNALAEVVINHTQLSGVPIIGTLDNAYTYNGDSLLISDYKTGSPLTSFNTKAQNKAIKAWRHNSQLLFYTLLAKSSPRFKSVKQIEAQMIYVEAEEAKDLYLKLSPGPEELDRLKKLIGAVWKHIQDFNFPDTSNYPEGIDGIKAFEEDIIKGK